MNDLNIKKVSGSNSTKIISVGEITYISYPALENTGLVRHGFSTRLGGISKGIFSTMNLSFTRGDEKENVLENFRRFAQALSIDPASVTISDQTHTANVRIMTKADRGKGISKERDFHDVDGMITNEPGVALTTLYADCVPLYFLDPVTKSIGLSHAGWKGTVNKIGKATADAMHSSFGTNPSDLIVCIGPSICQDCYEVSEDVTGMFYGAFTPEQMSSMLKKKANGKYNLDLWKANEFVLREAGIQAENITKPDICTCCNKQTMFSHRGLEGKRGNLAAILMLKS
ncbi:peptidoglycan editing factor PgeF [Parasporobacterium paucivorans]|uniref:Purine nucleoside phosphorylase n=1 Tax=Parasporobacterium paucivorans DSM 15970 TaxID=1122934 RepID=A0A1M6A064_9FIRM|nr:peptidoglycan editing factor PgeF [Parasporobacterium paucivorans]SHI29911.1 conserved hypothetical protein [Parasporobacterium paucivorans DSM 15970]